MKAFDVHNTNVRYFLGIERLEDRWFVIDQAISSPLNERMKFVLKAVFDLNHYTRGPRRGDAFDSSSRHRIEKYYDNRTLNALWRRGCLALTDDANYVVSPNGMRQLFTHH